MKKLLLACFVTITIVFNASAQEPVKVERDTIFIENQDTVLLKSYAKRYNPRKALLLAAIVPGLGQVYNKKYWKLPLVYGGFYLIGRQINFYNDIYTTYKFQLFTNLETNATKSKVYPYYTTDQLRRIVDRSRRERDFMVILMGGMYLLQIIDAHVDAHLKEFDLNPNLRVSLEPTITQDALIGRQTGMALVFRF
ncbi:hypothetical protein KK083_15580 [Fulvivirgaceae bacterium PWU4]|uniref:DUF5683 domain-containing protein n=1 Tax=Chryseosolibacter histidini TaxID=2782349 RepID=A0AAP2DL15_9BACT|nr:DUF5683 domain-containing protein [Chryseosolibacter histidini]MBT1698311.1 hypothetical protein [Chryseosolibacter histidini]